MFVPHQFAKIIINVHWCQRERDHFDSRKFVGVLYNIIAWQCLLNLFQLYCPMLYVAILVQSSCQAVKYDQICSSREPGQCKVPCTKQLFKLWFKLRNKYHATLFYWKDEMYLYCAKEIVSPSPIFAIPFHLSIKVISTICKLLSARHRSTLLLMLFLTKINVFMCITLHIYSMHRVFSKIIIHSFLGAFLGGKAPKQMHV